MRLNVAQPLLSHYFSPIAALFCLTVTFGISGCSSDDASPSSNTSPPATLNSDISSVPLSPTEADRFLAVTSTAGNQYYAAGFTTVSDDSHMAVARFAASGRLDPSFGSNGIATVNIAVGAGKKAELARSVVVQSDGKIVIAGPIEHDTAATGDAARDTDIAVVRFNATGQLDQTFGTNGITRLDLSTGTVSGTAFRGDTAWGLTLLPEDDLLIVGGKRADGAGRTDIDYAVAKLKADGSVDTTFGTNGLVTLDVEQGSDSPRTAIVQPDGKIVVSGHTEIAEDTPNEVVTTVLFRLTSNGQFDANFGNNGVVSNALGLKIAEAYDVALQGSSLVIAGYGRPSTATTVDIISARFLSDGTWDKTYGDSGLTVIDVAGQDDRSRRLKILPDQHVLIVGQGKTTATSQDGAVVLLTSNGQRDSRLNGNGVALVDFGGPTDALFGLALSPDLTQAVVVGWKGVIATESSPTNNDDARVVRFSLSLP
ncbi:MAG: hypothetical protein U0236_15515 [Nitrospira sp.]